LFSQQDICHFRTFGYVVGRGLLADSDVAQLRGEVTAALVEAFGRVGKDTDPEGTGGIRGDYLPLMADGAPLSQALVADDPRLFQGSVELLGQSTVPTAAIATCFTSNAGWHSDDGTAVGGVKFLVHLEARTADAGALRVIPGSHHLGLRRAVGRYFGQDPAGQGFPGWPVPFTALETAPGDVIAFDVHLFHSSAGGDNRLAWTIEYLPWPGLGDPSRVEATRAAIVDIVDRDHRGYDRDRWPTWREWAAGVRRSPSRQTAVERLRLLGVLGEGDPR
jgi:hypothetical protein